DAKGAIFGEERIAATVLANRGRPPADLADEILRAAARHAGTPVPDDDQIAIVVSLQDLSLTEKMDEYQLTNAKDTGAASAMLERRFHHHALQHGADIPRIERMWTAIFEALQNAIKFGSKSGDHIRISWTVPDEEDRLKVCLRQPEGWDDW